LRVRVAVGLDAREDASPVLVVERGDRQVGPVRDLVEVETQDAAVHASVDAHGVRCAVGDADVIESADVEEGRDRTADDEKNDRREDQHDQARSPRAGRCRPGCG